VLTAYRFAPGVLLLARAEVLRARGLDLQVEGAAEGSQLALDAPARTRDLDKALECLLENAFQAGAARVEARLGAAAGGGLTLELEDDGEGYPEGDLETLFLEGRTSREQGTGIGLGLARRLVRRHGGELELYRPERGAGVRLTLPPPAA